MRSKPEIADPEAEAFSRVAALKSEIAEVGANGAKVDTLSSDLTRRAQAVSDAHVERSADASIAGKPAPQMKREDAELVDEARQFAASKPVAHEKLERQRLALLAQLAEAEADLAGARFNRLRRRQRAAQARITEALAATAPDLAELLALDALQRRYCGGQQIMHLAPGDAPPFSGDVVVRNFTAQLPLQFRSAAIELLKLSEQSTDIVKEMSAEIEGNL